MDSNTSFLLVGAVLGVGFMMALAFSIISFLDHRYVTRLELKPTLEAMSAKLGEIGTSVERLRGE